MIFISTVSPDNFISMTETKRNEILLYCKIKVDR